MTKLKFKPKIDTAHLKRWLRKAKALTRRFDTEECTILGQNLAYDIIKILAQKGWESRYD